MTWMKDKNVKMGLRLALVGLLVFSTTGLLAQIDGARPVKIFILGGQSNMDGTGRSEDLRKPIAPIRNKRLRGTTKRKNGWPWARIPLPNGGNLNSVPR